MALLSHIPRTYKIIILPPQHPILANTVCLGMLDRMNNHQGSRHMQIHRYTVIFEPAEEGGYVVHVPALNDAATQGDTLEEARAMAKDLIIGYLEALAKDGTPAPVEDLESPTEPVREVLEVAVD
jgi:predicted RNase H-like HicB family nuclease